MNEYSLLNRRMLINNLASFTENVHLDFYQRATQTNLAFLNFGKNSKYSQKKAKEEINSSIV